MSTTTTSTPPGRGALDRLVEYSSREHFAIGASVLRIVAGSAILFQYLINYGQRGYLFGPDGLFPYDAFREGMEGFSLYALSDSPVFFEVTYHLGIIVGILFLLGWRTRWIAPLQYLFWFSMQQRFNSIWDGGDNLMRIVLVYGMFANLSAHFSIDARRRAANGPPPDTFASRALAMLHNTAILAIAIQLCLVYGIAGLSKVQGKTWQNGTALYHALRGNEFRFPGLSEALWSNGVVLTLLSYFTVAFQVGFTFLLFLNKWTRRSVLFVSISFHFAIGAVMGLVTFAAFLIASDMTLVSDAEYQWMFGKLRAARDRVTRLFRRAPSLTPATAEPARDA
jgi:hypothetical protein